MTRREAILAAAARMFAERSFRGVGMDDIGEAVGVTGPALYRHFAGKDDLLATLLLDVSARLLSGGRERAEGAATPDELIRALTRWQVEFALTNPELIVIQERDLGQLAPESQRAVRRTQRTYVEIWVAALADLRPGIDTTSARTAVHAAIGLINSTPHSVRRGTRETVAPLLERMAYAALSAA